VTLLAFAAERRAAVAPLLLSARRLLQARGARAAVDRRRMPAGRPAANTPHAAAAVDRWDRQTDGRTLNRLIDPAEYYVSSFNNSIWQRIGSNIAENCMTIGSYIHRDKIVAVRHVKSYVLMSASLQH